MRIAKKDGAFGNICVKQNVTDPNGRRFYSIWDVDNHKMCKKGNKQIKGFRSPIRLVHRPPRFLPLSDLPFGCTVRLVCYKVHRGISNLCFRTILRNRITLIIS